MTIPEISIIVPVYRVERYLDRCVCSILGQTFTDFELILVDDGSPDRCPQLCDEWSEKDPRIRVIHQKNKGLSAARNTGISAARGNYIGFVDSDDWISSDMYEILYGLLTEFGGDIACGKILRTSRENGGQSGESGRFGIGKGSGSSGYSGNRKSAGSSRYSGIRGRVCQYTQQEFAEMYFRAGSNETVHYVWNKLYTRTAARQMVFPEGLINEDVEGFFLALLSAKRIITTDKAVYYYWENPNGISFQWFTKRQMDLLTVWKHVRGICEEKKPEWVPYARMNYDRAFFGLLCRLCLSGESRVYPGEKDYLLRHLKMRYTALLRSDMPVSRKILMTGLVINYNWMEKGYGLFKEIRRRIKRRGARRGGQDDT